MSKKTPNPHEPIPTTEAHARDFSERYRRLDENGREIVSPLPLEPPLGYKKQPSMAEHIRELIRSERLKQEAEAQGMETFEEADDFDVGDDYEPHSPWENDFDPPISELTKAGREIQKSREAPPAPPSPSKETHPPEAPSSAGGTSPPLTGGLTTPPAPQQK